MRARTAMTGDLQSVFSDLSGRLADDYAASGVGLQGVRDALVMNLKEGRAHALVDGKEVIAIIAWHEDDGAVHTLFAAQERFFTASTVRFCRRHIRRIPALEGNLPVRHRSWLGQPDATRWFRVIGFVEIGTGTVSKLFELPPA